MCNAAIACQKLLNRFDIKAVNTLVEFTDQEISKFVCGLSFCSPSAIS